MKNIDPINRRMLQELATDGRISNVDLAEKVGLSPSACLRRVHEFERTGVIKGYRAIVDRSTLGASFTACIAIGFSVHSLAAQEAFERAASNAPEARECHNITGAVEYLLRVEVTDLPSYKAFHANVLRTLPHVSPMTTYVVMDSPKDERI